MAEKLIFCVDDEENIRDLYSCALKSSGFECACFSCGEELFEKLKVCLPDLILLDVMLEGMDGYEILQKIKNDAKYKNVPVIMVSAKGEETSRVRGLDSGADDYISKPFGVLELVARIRANLRRTSKVKILNYADIVIDDKMREVRVKGVAVELTLKEYELLKLLVANAPNVVSREEIFSAVWGEDYFGETRTLDIHVASLRKNIAESSAKINTVRGVGYNLK
ncbi:MAG: response regulator transcription factor [Christensenellaceae bacterium]